MKFIFWLLAIFSAAVLFALAANNPGYVLLVYPPYRIELSLTLFAISVLALMVIINAVFKLVLSVMRLPGKVRAYREQSRLNKGRNAMLEALSAYFEGRYAAAEKAAVRAMDLGDTSALNAVIAARSAHELRDFDKRDNYLVTAADKAMGDSTMRLIAQTEFQLDEKQPLLALMSLKELSATGKHQHIGALQLELKARQQSHDWDGVLSVLTRLEKRSEIAQEAANKLRLQAWIEKLRAQHSDLPALQTLWKSVPGDFKYKPKVSAMAAANFIKLRDCKSAQKILTDNLDKQWDSELVTLFGDCQDKNNAGQIEQAEKWLREHSDDAGLLLALGKLCLNHGLWGKAQNYLDASISLQPSADAYKTLAKLAESLHKPDAALKYANLAREIS
ncbi:MAG: heme biosynthesis HemY N-terminal domain-containing protein [Gallionellaceae bacterium]|jgi:HemY protein